MSVQSVPAGITNLQLGAPQAAFTGTISVTMLRSVYDASGTLLQAKTTQSVSGEFAKWLVENQFATTTSGLLPQESNLNIGLNQAQIQALVSAAGIVPVVPESTAAAALHSAAINLALAVSKRATIPAGLGIVWCSGTIVMPSGSTLDVGMGTTLKHVDGRQAPFIKNKFCGHIHNQPLFNRTSNVVTVADAGHVRSIGDVLFIGGANATFNGLVTISNVVPGVSWSYSLAGSDGSAGATGTFFNVIPITRTIAGARFSASAGYVTVADPGHNLYPGANVYVCKATASNFAIGMAQVAAVTADTWSYQTASAAGTDTGTLGISYDLNITITGGGAVDGNRLGAGTPSQGNVMMSCATMWGCVSGLVFDAAIGGSSIRGICANNCAFISYMTQWQPFDCLVGCQHEGGAFGVVVDQGVGGASTFEAVGAQQIDDYVAFTGTAFASGAGGNYDNTISPYGLTFFAGLEVRRIYPSGALNGVKITANSACPFVGTLKIGAIIGRFLNQNFSLGQGSAVVMFDDGPGLLGTTVETLDLVGPFEWKTPNASNAVISLAGAGSIGALHARGVIGESGPGTTIKVQNTIAIDLMDIDASKFIVLTTSAPSINLAGGNIKRLKLRNNRATLGSTQPLIYFNGATVSELEIDGLQTAGSAAATGRLLDIAVSPSFSRVTLRGIRNKQGGNTINCLMNIADVAMGTVDIVLEDIDMVSASGITSTGTGVTGTFNVFLGKKVRWAATGGNNFFQVGGGTWNVYGDPANRATMPAAKVFLTGFGAPTYKSLGFGQAVASSAAPALNCGLGNYVTHTVTSAETWGAPTNVPPAGTTVTAVITQDVTGGWAVSWNAAYVFPSAFSNTGNTANKKTTVAFVSDGTALIAQGANSWY